MRRFAPARRRRAFSTSASTNRSLPRAAPPREAVLLCAAALLADGRAPWRIGDVGIAATLAHERSVVELIADARGTSGGWRLSGDCDGELRAQRRGDVVRADFDGTAISGAVTYAVPYVRRSSRRTHVDASTLRIAAARPVSARGHHAVRTVRTLPRRCPGKIVKVAVRDGEARRRARAPRRARGDEDGAPHRSLGRRDRQSGPGQRGRDRHRRHAPGGTLVTPRRRVIRECTMTLPSRLRSSRWARATGCKTRARVISTDDKVRLHRSALGDRTEVDRGNVVRQPKGHPTARRRGRSLRAHS